VTSFTSCYLFFEVVPASIVARNVVVPLMFRRDAPEEYSCSAGVYVAVDPPSPGS